MKASVFIILLAAWLGSQSLSDCTIDEFLSCYNRVIQAAGVAMLTSGPSLAGVKENGIDDYTGTYHADYENASRTEYIFGGTSIDREAGKRIGITCTLEVQSGSAKVFWLSGDNEPVVLLKSTSTYSDTLVLPEGGNYIGIECDGFTGSVDMKLE